MKLRNHWKGQQKQNEQAALHKFVRDAIAQGKSLKAPRGARR
jgi:hypothetical protein